MVDSMIRLMSFDVFVSVLQCCDTEDDQERQNNQTRRDGREFREELQDGDTQEEDVGDSPKLLKQISREEGDDGILAGDVLIRRIDLVAHDPPFLVTPFRTRRQRRIDVHLTCHSWSSLPFKQGGRVKVGELLLDSIPSRWFSFVLGNVDFFRRTPIRSEALIDDSRLRPHGAEVVEFAVHSASIVCVPDESLTH